MKTLFINATRKSITTALTLAAILLTTQSCYRMGGQENAALIAKNCACTSDGSCGSKASTWDISIAGGDISIATDNKGLTHVHNNPVKQCPDMGCIDIAFPNHEIAINY